MSSRPNELTLHPSSTASPWLAQVRAAAEERFRAGEFPTSSEEAWRYSPIADVPWDSVAFGATSAESADAVAQWRRHLDTTDVVVEIIDGSPVLPNELPDGIAVGLVNEETLDLRPIDGDIFDDLNQAVADTLVIDVAAGAVIDRPLVLIDHVAADAAATALRVLVNVGEGASATLCQVVSGGADGVRIPVGRATIEAHGQLRLTVIEDPADTAWQLGRWTFDVASDATLDVATAVLGGKYTRMRMDCSLNGPGAVGNLAAVYVGAGDSAVDLRTFQLHAGPRTSSELQFHGAVGGSSRTVYVGMIRIAPEGAGSVAHQTNRILKLSDDAWAESVPNLEIHNNDVVCSHASAVGTIDDDHRFYLESRGVPPAVAERLVVEGFLTARTEALHHDGLAAYVRDRIAEEVNAGLLSNG